MIELKWLKKLKSWFQAEEEIIEIEEIIVDETIDEEELKKAPKQFFQKKKEEQKQASALINKTKEVEAKIQYQYPKGKFRFPIVPDEEFSKRKPKIRKKENHLDTVNSMVGEKEKTTEYKTYVSRNTRENTKIHKKTNRPFSPTEIPSPIYGFKRPEKPIQTSSQFVEYELTSSFNDKSLSDKKLEEIPAIYRQKRNERFADHRSEQRRDDLVQKDLESAKDHDAADNETIHKNSKTENGWSIQNNSPAIAFADHTILMPEDGNKDSNHLVLEENIENRTNLMVEKDQENSSYLVQEEHLQDHSILEPEEDLETITTSGSEEALRDNTTLEQERATETEKPKRKHIPFNVVMLKQDKQRLAEKNARMASQEKKTERVENHDPIIKNEPVLREEAVEDLPYYQFPSIDLLSPPIQTETEDDDWLEQQAFILNETLKNFNVRAKVVNVTQGPAVTRFEVQPEAGVKVNKVTNLTDDIKLSLAAQDIRMEAPIPGKHTIGIEIPNRKSKAVFLREILESPAFRNHSSPLTVALGLDISGEPIVTDLKKMPHGLIAGATGSGKSVCINTMLISLLYKATPNELKLLLIDPKMVELAPYNGIPHLVSPVITDVKAATAALKWAVDEMERRYELFAHAGVRDIQRFNQKAAEAGQFSDKLPYIVIVIDELADLMMMSPADVEEAICRIAQKARACGIHLIVATQRPSVDVITGLIKANIPTRIAFSVSSQIDSRTIIDVSGAEKLLGKGDMLFLENGSSKTVRLQGTFVSDDEIDLVVNHVKKEQSPNYLFHQEELLSKAQLTEESDELFLEACEFVVSQNAASTSSLQRHFRIGYNRAARLMEMLEKHGVISEARGSKPRDVLIREEEMEQLLNEKTGIQ